MATNGELCDLLYCARLHVLDAYNAINARGAREDAHALIVDGLDKLTKAAVGIVSAPTSLSVSIALTDPAAATEVAERVAQVVAEMGHGSVVAVVPLDGAS